MNKDITACNGTVGNTQTCKIKETCKRFAVHNNRDKNQYSASYQKITVQMYQKGDCMFLVKL